MAGNSPAIHDTGSGPVVLFLHASPLDGSQWDHQVAALSGDHRCLRPDFWGCGHSPEAPAGAGLDTYATAVLGLLDECEVESVAVVGLSLGGYIAFELLRQAPSRIIALVLADTRATADTDAVRAERALTAARARREGVEFQVEPTVERLLSPRNAGEAHVSDPLRGRVRGWSGEGLAMSLEAMARRPDSSSLLGTIGVPTLVVTGEHDAITTPEQMGRLADSIAGARHEVVPEAGHLSNLENAPVFSLLVGNFLGAC